MIDLKNLVKSVQVASQSAVEAIASENLKIFNTYFEKVEDDLSDQNINKKLSRNKEETIPFMISNFNMSDGVRYKPRMIAIQYPTEDVDGPKIQDVYVPLLTLVPISMPQLSELRFSTDLEMVLDENAPDNIKVSFPKNQKTKSLIKQQVANEDKAKATLDIVINSANISDGLQKIIEGYEKALRAQIPM